MNTTNEQRRATIAKEGAEFKQYRNSDQMRQFFTLLDALIDDHKADLVTITAEKLQYKQGAIAQLQILRDYACSDSPHISPKA